MPVRAVLLDAFGTLIRPEPGWETLRRECLTIVHGGWSGRAVPLARFLAEYERARDAQRAALGETLREPDLAERFSAAIQACGAPRAEARAWGPGAAERYHRFQQALVHAYDAPAAALGSLRKAGLRLAVVSNFGHAGVLRDALGRLGLLPHLDAVVVSAEVGYLKPHPAVFGEALRRVGARPDEAVMVGDDAERDVRGAKRAGMRAVWIPFPRDAPAAAPPPEADAVARRLADLPDLVARMP